MPLVTQGQTWRDPGVPRGWHGEGLGGAAGHHQGPNPALALAWGWAWPPSRARWKASVDVPVGCEIYGATAGLRVFPISLQEEGSKANAFLLLSQRSLLLQHQTALTSAEARSQPRFLTRRSPCDTL